MPPRRDGRPGTAGPFVPPARALARAVSGAVGRAREDVAAIVERDPAAGSPLEAALTSPGLHALWAHRVAHRVWQAPQGRGRIPARLIANAARTATGVEIHPAAVIGRRVVIDHGMGIVVGETAQIGDDVQMYHGVTLGAVSSEPGRRHPTVGSRVILGAGATVLGAVEIADDSAVGAGAVVLHDVPPATTVVGVPARPVRHRS